MLTTLNKRYDYGLDLYLLSIDEGIIGYRDESLKTVEQNANDYNLPLVIYSYKVNSNRICYCAGLVWLHNGRDSSANAR